MIYGLLRKAVGFPPLIDMIHAGEVFKYGLGKMPRFMMAAQPEVAIKLREKRTTSALLTHKIFLADLRFLVPLLLIELQ